MSALLESLAPAALPPHAERFRDQVRSFLRAELPELPIDIRVRSWMGFDAGFSRKLASCGWVGVTLPREYGGAAMDVFSRFVLAEELLASGAPVAAHWTGDRQSGPLLVKFGTEAQRRFYLPKICAGEAIFCIGMSEPGAGSDLAGVATRATPAPGGCWTLSGHKIWTSNAHRADYMIALVRTSGTPADRQTGLSQFIIDLRLPGITIRPIRDIAGDAHFCEVFFDQVPLAPDALVGAEGAGWQQVTAELAYERSGPERFYSSVVLLDCWIASLRRQGRRPAAVAAVGRFTTHLAALRNLSIAVTAKLYAGESPSVAAALVKDLGTEFEQAIPAAIEAALGADPDTPPDLDLLRATTYVSQIAPTFSLRGGTREILRGVIARGLGLR